MHAAAEDHGLGSFSLADELLDLETLDIEVLNSDGVSPAGIDSSTRSLPGHHRATLLLDGISASSSGSSRHGSPASSFNARQAAADAAGTAGEPPAAPAAEAQTAASEAAATAGIFAASSSAGTPSELLQAAAGADNTTTTTTSPPVEPPNNSANHNSSNGALTSSSAVHSVPTQLQLPDFAAFMLPPECAFAESSIDDALTTPTPHTPVVPSIFSGDGLPVVSARVSRPHYSSGSSCSSTTSNIDPTAAAGGSEGGGACSGGGNNHNSSGITVTQLGTCRALLIDNPDEEEYVLDPFPAAITSPSHHRHAGAGSHDGGLNGSSSRMYHEGDDGWDAVPFASLLCRRTLSTVSEAPNEGLEEEPSTTACCGASGSPTSLAPTCCSQAGAVCLQQQQQQQHEAVSGSCGDRLEQERQQQQQLCVPLEPKDAPAALPALSPKAAPSGSCDSCDGSSSSSNGVLTGSTLQQGCSQPLTAEQEQQQQEHFTQLGASSTAVQADGDPSLAVLLTASGQGAGVTCCDGDDGALDVAAVELELCSSTAAAAAAKSGELAQQQQQQLQLQQPPAGGQQQLEQQQPKQQAADEPLLPAGAAVAVEATDGAATAEPSKQDKSGGNGSSSSGGSKVVCVTATAVPAAAEEVEDVWATANKQRMQQLLMQQQPQQQVSNPTHLTYAAAEQQLLAAAAAHISSSSGSGCSNQGVRTQEQQQDTQLQQTVQRPSSWQRLLACGGCGGRMGSGCARTDQQQQLLLQLAKTPFSDSNPLHLQLLQAVYTAYTGAPGPALRLGPHWAELGFQGDDPATDLRGAGMLGLLQLLYLHMHDAAAAERLYTLARSGSGHDFPLAIVSMNLTAWTLSSLRAGRLDRAARQLGGHAAAANHLYCGTMYEFANRWSQGKHTMLDSGWLLKRLQQHCSSHTRHMLQLATAVRH